MPKQKQQPRPAARPGMPASYRHAAAIAVIILSLVVFFHDAIFSGKVVQASDNIASQSFKPFLEDAAKEGIYPLWVPYIFGGMPSYASLLTGGPRTYDLTEEVVHYTQVVFTVVLGGSDVTAVLFYYVIFGVAMYLFMLHKKKGILASLFTSLATLYSTYVIILIVSGHNTKIPSICLLPIVLMIAEKMIDDFRWWHLIVLVVAIHLQQLASHIQMIYYSYLLLVIYYLYLLVARVVKKESWFPVVRSGLVLVVAAGLSFAMSADLYLSTLEYNPYSIRGSNPILETAKPGSKTEAGGLDYDYATSWSFSPGEALTFVVPSLYGFGEQEYVGPLTGNRPAHLPTYWGQMPWTEAPQYMGVIVLFFAAAGFYYNRKDRFIQAMTVAGLFALVVSFGKTMPLVYDLMYRYAPLFNKFRVPSMILIILQIVVPIMAGFGFQSVTDRIREKLSPQSEKRLQYALGTIGALLVLGFIARGLFEDFYKGFMGTDGMAKLMAIVGRQPENVLAQVRPMLFDFVFSSAMSDYFIVLFLLLVTVALIYAYRKSLVTATTLGVVVIGLTIFDLWRVDMKPMELQDQQAVAASLITPDYIKAIQRDSSLYRVLDTENLQAPSNTLANYRLQSIGGYHGAKLRVYQDVVDVAGLGNPLVWQLMNTKYIIANPSENLRGLPVVYSDQQKKVFAYPPGSERAWFVDSVRIDSGLGILTRMKAMSFDPQRVAYLERGPLPAIDMPDSTVDVSVKDFDIHRVTFAVTASGTNLLYVSEIYYPKGWIATIDGNPTTIYKTDYAFRSVVVPKGKHVVEFRFEPSGYFIGRTISLLSNLLAWGGLAAFGYVALRRKKRVPGRTSAA